MQMSLKKHILERGTAVYCKDPGMSVFTSSRSSKEGSRTRGVNEEESGNDEAREVTWGS